MKTFSKIILISCLFLLLLTFSLTGYASENVSHGYHDFQALSSALKQIASQNTNITKLISIGKTLKGKEIWLLRISGSNSPSPLEKQALLICGNLEGDHVIGSEVALGIAEYFVSQYGKDDKVTKVLDKRTFYIIPRLNPDGAEFFFAKIRQEHAGNLKPRDEDYDWLMDEDGPEDLNGDGKITLMRVKDKDGNWYIDEKDARLMKKKKDDTPLDKLYKIYPEGIDDDEDELYNEDGAGGFNTNRNFPHNFGYNPKGVGVYPASEKETQAVIDFMTRYVPELKTQPHKNICGVLLFSKFDNLAAESGINCGTPSFPQPQRVDQSAGEGRMFFSFGRRGQNQAQTTRPTDPQPKKINKKDEYIFKSVSKKYKEISGIKSAHSEKPAGSMLEWAYFQFGVPSFSANLWSLRKDEQKSPRAKIESDASSKPASSQAKTMDRSTVMRQFMSGSRPSSASQDQSSDTDEKWLKWVDKENGGTGFVTWTKFDHKQLGEVEIGGFEPYIQINPPAEKIPELIKSHAKFALYLAAQFAEIKMDEPEIKKLSSNLFELKIKIHNKGDFPYATAMGERTNNINSIMVKLKFEDDKKMKLFGGSKRIDIQTLRPGAEKDLKWTIISPEGKKINITLWARTGGGKVKKTVVLR